MKKKIIIVLLIIISLFITGCSTEEETTSKTTGTPTIKYKDDKIKLENENNLKDMYFKENNTKFILSTVDSYHLIEYNYNDEFVFEIRMAYVNNKSLKEATKDLSFSTITKKVGDYQYKYGVWELDNENNGKLTAHQYFYEYNGTTYTICFFSASNLGIFEDLFMKNIEFKKTN